jgi:hypothetical protein
MLIDQACVDVFGASLRLRGRIATLCVRALSVSCVIVAACVMAGCASSSRASENPCPAGDSSIIHTPDSGLCPEGYELRDRFFAELDGSKEPACVSATRGDGSIDCLKPGEGFGITVEIHVPSNRKI